MQTFFTKQLTNNVDLSYDDFNAFFMADNSLGGKTNTFQEKKNKFEYSKDWTQSNRLQTIWDQVRIINRSSIMMTNNCFLDALISLEPRLCWYG